MLTLRLPPKIEARLAALARATGRSKSFHVREAILVHLDDLEDLCLAGRLREALRSGRSTTVPLEELERRYGLAD